MKILLDTQQYNQHQQLKSIPCWPYVTTEHFMLVSWLGLQLIIKFNTDTLVNIFFD